MIRLPATSVSERGSLWKKLWITFLKITEKNPISPLVKGNQLC